MDIAALLDAAAPEPVLVIGSPPPAGRDLDLLVRPVAEAALLDALSANDFHGDGRMWVRFADCGAEVVEIIPADSLGLERDQLERLFAHAQPIAGLTSLVRPSAHHRLLLVARRVAREARLDDKRRAAIAEAGEEDWRKAREAAPAWGADRALSELEQALAGEAPRSWRTRSILARADRYRPGALIAISGLDGSGKSTQVEGLARSLSTLGYPTVEVWTSLAAHPALSNIAAPARALLGRRRSPRGPEQERPPAGEDDDRLTRLRERVPGLQLAWVCFVAVMNAWWQARAVRPHLLRGRIVICDRYTLDSIVHLRYRYGHERRYRAQLALIRLCSPRPLRAYMLEVAPATAYTRNQEYTPEQVQLRARLYDEESASLGIAHLDGERPREDLCEQIALEVSRALAAERDDARPLPARLLLALSHRLKRR